MEFSLLRLRSLASTAAEDFSPRLSVQVLGLYFCVLFKRFHSLINNNTS